MRFQGVAVWVCMTSATASAQVDAGFRLGADTLLFQYDAATLESMSSSFGGSTVEASVDTTRFGLGATELGLSPALVIGGSVVLGARLGVLSQSSDSGDSGDELTVSSLGVTFVPFFEYAFLHGSRFRPALGVGVGVMYDEQAVEQRETSPSRTIRQESDRIAFLLTAFLRLHLFATDGFSIAPGLVVRYHSGARTADDPGSGDTLETDESHIVVGFGLDVAGWVGSGTMADAPEASTEWSPSAASVEAPPAQQPPPPPSNVMTTRLMMSGASADLSADPTVAGGEIAIRIARLSRTVDPTQCTTLTVETATQARDVSAQSFSRPASGFFELGSVARVPYAALIELARSDAAALRLCEERWELSSGARHALSVFLERYLVAASSHGNPPPDLPPPPPEPEPWVVPPETATPADLPPATTPPAVP